ncbi:MAG: aminoacyl-tRNA hydrolase [Pirellulales bacterium]|nr:aminoacyl-tRNA hydrolase [Pirellulales bacterium]
MKLIVGLGNPDRQYQGTRHNVGFLVLAELARRHGQSRPKAKFHGELVEAAVGSEKAMLLGPMTYMNRSGLSVQEASSFYKLPLEDLLVVCDDLNLPLAKLRLRSGGSSGGQKGLEDIIRRLGTEEFARLRVGIGAAPEGVDAADYVLSKFSKKETSEMEGAIASAADAAVCWATRGINDAMNQYN